MLKSFAFLVIPALLVLTQSAQGDRVIISSYAPPSDLAELVRSADVVAVIRVTSTTPWESHASARSFVEHTAIVQEFIKGSEFVSQGPTPTTIRFVEEGGERLTPSGKVKSTNTESLENNEDGIVFLTFTPALNRFQLAMGPHGLYKIKNGALHAAAPSDVANE